MSLHAFLALVSMALTLAGTAAAQGYGRGDADCSAHQSAADILATAHGLHGDSACDNDDCDRSGTVDAADVSCSASCLFGDCRAPAHAPQITGGAPTTGSLIRAYAPLRLDGVNFAGDSALVTVEIGGVPAEIVEITGSDSIVVSVPPLLPGPTIVTVTTGDLTGPPRSIVITPQTGVGAADSFDGFLALLDLFLERLAELDLQDIYGDDTEAVLEAIAIFRDDLETQRAALAQDPQLTTELRQRIDAAIDSSGAAEILRDALDDIEAVLDGAVAGSGPRQTLVVNNAIRAARGATLVARAAGAAAGGTLLGPGALIAIGIGTLAGALTLTGAALPPIITEVVFLDRSQVRSEAIHVNGFIRIHGRRLTGSNLVLRLRRGDLVLAPEQSGPGFLQFRLAPTFGFCGSIEYFLRRALPLTGTSQRMRWRVEAELLQLLPIDPLSSAPLLGRSGQTLSMLTNGVAGCTAAARFERPNAPMGEIFSTQIRALNSSLISAPLPHVPGGEYLVEVIADTIISNALPGLTIINPIAGIDVTCSAHRLNLSPGMPDRTTCTAKLLPQSATAPFGSRLVWTSSDGGTATIEGGGSSVVVHAREPGMTRVSAILKAGNRVLAETDADVDIVVADISEPNVFAIPAPPLLVAPGATVRVAVQASDNYLVSRLVLRASGDAAVVAEQEVPCLTLESDCNAVFNVQIKETGFTDRRVTLVADAYDGSGNKGSSQDVVVSIRDNTCPTLAITAPAAGVVDPGAMVLVEATASDADMNDGVKKLRYSASGDALVQQISQDLDLPQAVATVPLRFTFEVKSAEELAAVTNRVINVSVEAFDTAGASCGAQTLALTAAGTGDVQIILSWDNSNDLDLFVIEPSGEQISYLHLMSSTGGRLDVDANPGCSSTSGSPVENVFWPTGQAPNGTYQVSVSFFEACTEPATASNYTVRVIVDGVERPPVSGNIGSGSRQVTTFSR